MKRELGQPGSGVLDAGKAPVGACVKQAAGAYRVCQFHIMLPSVLMLSPVLSSLTMGCGWCARRKGG